jgi:hypothetical protein
VNTRLASPALCLRLASAADAADILFLSFRVVVISK